MKYLLHVLLVCIPIICWSANFTTVQDGPWEDPATWGGVTVSTFFNPPQNPGEDWFTSGGGDIIMINHQVTFDNYDLFVRNPDILVINSTGSLTATSNGSQFFNLSNGGSSVTLNGQEAGVIIYGTLAGGYLRNSSILGIGTTGQVNLSVVGALSGGLDNFGDIYHYGTITAVEVDHNTNDINLFANSLISVTSNDFQNRGLLNGMDASACILVNPGSFMNLSGGAAIGDGSIVAAGTIDNSANPINNWGNTMLWCAGGSGLNLPAAAEDCTTACALLPVEFVSFDAKRMDKAILLEWTTVNEVNNERFIIERSRDGRLWESIGTELGQGDYAGRSTYHFVDEKPQLGTNHYRLKQVDFGGNYSYSPVRMVQYHPTSSPLIHLAPNPVQNGRTILTFTDELNLAAAKIRLINPAGQVVWVRDLWQTQAQLDTQGLPTGMYWLEVIGNSRTEQQKLVIP